ncbi:MAG: hypothetical protein BRC36_04910 [Cyanobacteria bacterium QH_2_48_84]|nr:MAG: hypothetical protein BRC36_04910 [Cyanobacteria bacterium QH_2_48_84]
MELLNGKGLRKLKVGKGRGWKILKNLNSRLPLADSLHRITSETSETPLIADMATANKDRVADRTQWCRSYLIVGNRSWNKVFWTLQEEVELTSIELRGIGHQHSEDVVHAVNATCRPRFSCPAQLHSS